MHACRSLRSFYFPISFFLMPLHNRIQTTNSNVAQPGFFNVDYFIYLHHNTPTIRYEAHRDECLACFDALCVHWKEAKGRGHPAAVAALNSVAEVLMQYTEDGAL